MSLEVSIKKKLGSFSLEVDFSTDSGTMGILGASGCGKSMTLKCIAGIETPDEGRILMNHRVLYDSKAKKNLPPQQRQIGYLFQNYALFPHMTVAENIACGQRTKGERILPLLEKLQLEGLENRYPAQLSGGQQQRVALARMLASQPQALLLDEPFSALDAYLKEQLQLELLTLLEEWGKDALLVTHSREEAYRLCQRLLILEQGRPLAMGETAKIFQNPVRIQAARLTGCRNFSRLQRMEDGTLQAVDWANLKIFPPASPPDWATHVGVLSHSFQATPISQGICFPVQPLQRLESPFEEILVFASGESGEVLWWEVPKKDFQGVPEFLWVDPRELLFLRE